MFTPSAGTQPTTAAKAVPVRLRHVDSLRAVAAGLVMWFHFDQTLAPISSPGPAWLGFLHAWPQAIDVGQVGVFIFFAVSGFVICRSFGGPRAGGARRFLVRRFCRLYPAYWASIPAGIAVCRVTGQAVTWPMLAANASMLPGTLGFPRLLGVYWTLEIELLFYALCLGLFLTRCLERPGVLTAVSMALIWLPRALKATDHAAGTHLAFSRNDSVIVLALAVMFWGAVFRLAYDATDGFRRAIFRRWETALTALLALSLTDLPVPGLGWVLFASGLGRVQSHASVAAAVLIFALWVAWWRVDGPVVTYLGVISYSLYLFHPVAKYALVHWIAAGHIRLPLPLCMVGAAALSVALAAPVYRWVERPALAWGKRRTGSVAQTVPIDVAESRSEA